MFWCWVQTLQAKCLIIEEYKVVQNPQANCLIFEMYNIIMKIRSSCEIEYFVETHLCKLCVILQSGVLRVVCPHSGYNSGTFLATAV